MIAKTRADYVKVLFKLKQKECVIFKTLKTFVVPMKFDPDLKHSITKNLNGGIINMNNIHETYKDLNSVKIMAKSEYVKDIDVEVYKEKLKLLWKRIQDLRDPSILIENLKTDQQSIDSQLYTCKRSIQRQKSLYDLEQMNNNKLSNRRPFDKPSIDPNFKNSQDFWILLSKTGHNGNWNAEDHSVFLKLRKKCKTVPCLVTALQSKFPDLSKEDIVNHEIWYKTYLDLRTKLKNTLQEWRKKKDAENNRKVGEDDENTIENDKKVKLTIGEHKRAEMEKKKEMIRKWKEEREKTRLAEDEKLKIKMRIQREQKEQERQAYALKIKNLVEDQKEHKIGTTQEKLSNKVENLQNIRRINRVTLNVQKIEDDKVFEKKLTEEKVVDNLDSWKSLPKGFLEKSFKPRSMLSLYRDRDNNYLKKRLLLRLRNSGDLSNSRYVRKQDPLKNVRKSTFSKDTESWALKQRQFLPDIMESKSSTYIKDLPTRSVLFQRAEVKVF